MNADFLACVAKHVARAKKKQRKRTGLQIDLLVPSNSATAIYLRENTQELTELGAWFGGLSTTQGSPGQRAMATLTTAAAAPTESWWERVSKPLVAIEHERSLLFGLLWVRCMDNEKWANALSLHAFGSETTSATSLHLMALVAQSLGAVANPLAPVIVVIFALRAPRLNSADALRGGWPKHGDASQPPLCLRVQRLSAEECKEEAIDGATPPFAAHDIAYITVMLGVTDKWLLPPSDTTRRFVFPHHQ